MTLDEKTSMLADIINSNLKRYQNEQQDELLLLHSGRKGMKWGMHIFGNDRTSSSGGTIRTSNGGVLRRFRRKTPNNVQRVRGKQGREIQRQSQNVNDHLERKSKKHRRVNEHEREADFINEYNHRDKMSTKAIKARTDRLNAEYAFREAVYRQQEQRNKQAAEIAAKRRATAVKVAKIAGKTAVAYGLDKVYEQSVKRPDPTRFDLTLTKNSEGKSQLFGSSENKRAFAKANSEWEQGYKMSKEYTQLLDAFIKASSGK